MIYLISDIHGDVNFKGLQDYLRIATEKDLLIVLGDICVNFENTQENAEFSKFFMSIKKNVAFIDGNHENFTYLNSFPIETWNGGVARRLTDNIVYLQRGNIYEIDGKTFFTFGGCKSSSVWVEKGLMYPEEAATVEQCEFAKDNLKKNNYSVDYILTHKREHPKSSIPHDENLYSLCEFIETNVDYKKWYFGHSHKKSVVDDKHEFIYDELTSLDSSN